MCKFLNISRPGYYSYKNLQRKKISILKLLRNHLTGTIKRMEVEEFKNSFEAKVKTYRDAVSRI